jgi:AcrR family transcriptional regulator
MERSPRRQGRPVSADGEDTRQRIIEGARECFAAYGYAATSNRLIAQRTDLTAAAVYHHFGRKGDLMIAVYQATAAENYARIRAGVSAEKGLVAKVQAVLESTHQTLVEDPAQGLFMFVAREEARRHEELAEIARDDLFTGLFSEIVNEAVHAGEISPRDARGVRGALAVVALGLASLGSDVTISAHRTATDGCKRLVAGTLLRPTKRGRAATG